MHMRTDLSTFIGIILACGLIGAAIWMGGSPKSFIDYPSVLIVIGGTFAVTTACFSFKEVFKAFGLVFKTIFYHHEDPAEASRKILSMAEEARKNGVLALQSMTGGGSLLARGLGMVVDGLDPDAAERILRQDIQARMERHQKGVSILRKASEVSPAMGLIGTLIGLVQMLGNLNDPSSIGPAMAVALLTTLYGALLAYVVFIPLASKLERNSQEELLTDQVYMKGVACIGRRENPRRIEMLLNTILPPEKRLRFFD